MDIINALENALEIIQMIQSHSQMEIVVDVQEDLSLVISRIKTKYPNVAKEKL